MGMYTEIQGTIEFTTEALAKCFVGENHWSMMSHTIDKVKPFVTFSRSHWIPHSGDGVKSIEGKTVKFHSELKDYDHTIQEFLKLLPHMAKKWCLETRYEECSNWTLHRNDEEDIDVNGDNYFEREWSNVPEQVYPDFDVFDEGNLK